MRSKKIRFMKQQLFFILPLSLPFIAWNTDMKRIVWNGSSAIDCKDLSCVAVGGYNVDGILLASRQPFTMYSNDLGKTFDKALEAPVPTKADLANGAQLMSVNCVKDRCVAVGGYALMADLFNAPQSMSGTPLVVTSDDGGRTFTHAYAAPLPTGGDTNLLSHLAGVNCQGDECVAVGQYNFDIANNNGVGLAYNVVSHDGGHTFVGAAEPTLPADQNASRDARLFGVSCSGNECVAVGRYADSNNNLVPLAVFSEDGGATFDVASSPALPNNFLPTEKFGSLYAVTCNNQQVCIAIGSYTKYFVDNSPRTPFVTISYDGGRTFTSTSELALPANANAGTHAQITGISCVDANKCTIVGTYNIEVNFSDSMGFTGGVPFVAESTDGGATFAVSSDMNIPNPVDEKNVTELTSISCGYYCVAVGSYNMSIEYTNPKSGTAFTLFNNKMGAEFSNLFVPELPSDADFSKASVFGNGNIGL